MVTQKATISILLVDDDPAHLEVAQSILKDIDPTITIDTTQTVDEAHTKLTKNRYDVIVSDYEMQPKNGIQFLKEIRENNNTIPFILFTGKGREEIAIQALNLGADRYLNKYGNPETVYKELTISIHQLHDKANSKRMLHESEQRLRLFIENAPEAIFISDIKGRLLDQNHQIETLTGYTKEELLGKDISEAGLITPEAFKTAKEHLEHIEVGNKKGPTEFILKRKDGTTVTVEISTFPLKRGEEIELLGVARDITERKVAERELQQKYEALERVAKSLDSGLAIIGKDYRVIWANTILQRVGIHGTKHCYQIFNNLEQPCPDCGVKKVFENNANIDIHEYKTTDTKGKLMWVELRVTPLKDKNGNIIAALELAVPITERKKAEAELKESEERYAKLSAAAFEGIMISRKGIILDANAQFLQFHGYSLDELVGKSAPELLVAPQFRELVRKNMVSGFEGPYEFAGIRKDGSTFIVEVRAKSITYKGEPARVSAIQDITQRKKTEQQLLIFSSLFELASDAIYVCDLDGRIVYFNEATHKTAGYSRDEMSKMTLFDFCPPWQVDNIRPRIRRVVENQSAVFEAEHMRKDGSIIQCEVSGRVIDANGTKLLLNVARDISERKKAQQALQKSQDAYRMITENMRDVITVTDAEGNFVYVSPSAQSAYGYTPEEMLSKNAFDLTHPDDMTAIVVPIKALLKTYGSSPLVQIRFKKKDGSYVWIESNAKAFTGLDGNPRILAVARTIEDRKKVERELKLASDMFDVATDAIYVHDLNGDLLHYNEAAYKMWWGYTKEELSKVKLNELEIDESPDFVNEKLNEIIQNGYAVFETWFLAKDKTKHPVEVHAKLVDVEGKKILSVVRDISERKKAEARLAEVNEKLRVVGSLTRHDVRNKLTTVNSTTYLLKKKYGSDPELAKYLSSIESAVAMANRLFDFSAFYEKIGAENLMDIDVKTCFDTAASLLPNIGNIKVLNETAGLVVTADSLLQQVFYNLIDNSLKHGNRVTQIHLYYRRENNQTKLFYEDNGVGVSVENKPKIFYERFTTGNGTGLGLSMIRRMLDVYNWSIQETGVPNEGVRFEITIPQSSRIH